MMRSIGFVLASVAIIAVRANAQGMISGAKAVAGRAAGAANAHITAEQSPTATPTPTAKSTPITTTAAPTPVATTTKSLAAPAATVKAVPTATTKPVAVAKTATVAKAATVAKTAPAAAPVVTSDTGARSISVTQRGMKGEVSLNREVFSYDAGGRRDPFVSLLRNGDLRPMLNDLRLVAVLYDPTGRNSVAVMNDITTKDNQYRVKVGQTLGRMRVAGIEPREVVFTIEEIGFSRQEALVLGDSSRVRTQ
ncbi:MAG TPA: hypothetical protein VK807_06375 [Gemmatimonadaceae bacterium]|nr:hypothetical protein [Gemmatimonadaceae bacterium]